MREPANRHPVQEDCTGPVPEKPVADTLQQTGASRRDVVRHGLRMAFTAPVIMTFSASEARAAGSNLSCYPQGHTCPGMEPCCDDLDCNGGTCGDPCGATGEICFTNSDCCSDDCDLGLCK